MSPSYFYAFLSGQAIGENNWFAVIEQPAVGFGISAESEWLYSEEGPLKKIQEGHLYAFEWIDQLVPRESWFLC